MKTEHVIFDCDGVLVDSEPLSMRADVMLLRSVGIEMSETEAHHRFVGKTFKAMLAELTDEFGVTFPADFTHQKDELVEGMYRKALKVVDGVPDMLRNFAARGITCSVGSNSPLRRVQLALKLTHIAPHFKDITTKDEVPNGKPAPDVYLRALEKSGAAKNQCLVVEDSVTGVTAGVAAGIKTIGFTGAVHSAEPLRTQLLGAGAAIVIRHMSELTAIAS